MEKVNQRHQTERVDHAVTRLTVFRVFSVVLGNQKGPAQIHGSVFEFLGLNIIYDVNIDLTFCFHVTMINEVLNSKSIRESDK